MVRAEPYVKTAEDSYFRDLDMVVSSRLLIVGQQEYDLTRASSCEVVPQPRKPDWPRFLREELKVTAVIAPIWAIIAYFNWLSPPLLLVAWLVIEIRGVLRELGEPVRYALVLNTGTGPITILTGRDNTFTLAANEINKRIAGLPLLSEPSPTGLPQPSLQDSGEPTRRMIP
jgi:hypothetical protein